MYTLLNADGQTSIFYKIMHMIATQSSEVYFLYGYGGTSKTFVWKTLSSAIRSNGSIVLAVASSVIASILQPKHSTNTIYYVFYFTITYTALNNTTLMQFDYAAIYY